MSTAEQTKQTVSRYLQRVWNDRDFDAAGLFISNEYDPGVPIPLKGPDAARALVHSFLAAFSDFRIEVVDCFGESNKVAVRYFFHGTHSGTWRGVEATHKQISVEGITIYKLRDDRIIQTWFSYDGLGLVQQLDAPSRPSKEQE